MRLTRFTKSLVIFVIFDFFMFFILEAVFWMQPFIHNLLLDWFDNPPAGLYQIKKNKMLGYGLILLICFAAIGAGLVLAATSNAYLLACLQAIPAAIAFYNIYPLIKDASADKN